PAELLGRIGGRPLLWVHAASVGEVLASVPLLNALRGRFAGHAIVVSATTLTGRDVARGRPEADGAFLLPIDARPAIDRVLDRLRPAAFFFLETEIWPNLLRALDARDVPAILLSGRISPRSFPHYRRVRSFLAQVFAHVRLFGMQSDAEAERIRALGAPPERVVVTGSLKLDAGVPPGDLRVDGDDALWIAGSTHAGEEETCAAIFRRLRERFPRLRLLLAPRHLDRLDEVERLLQRTGVAFVRRSHLSDAWDGAPSALLLDTLGELAALYPRAAVAFIGGTLVPVGGHNLLEPARAGVPILFGPHVENVVEMARALEASGGGRRVAAADELERAIVELLEDPERRRRMGASAARTFPAGAVAERSLEAALPFLPRRPG
ncbi:MAG: 3-deoxy-D-manno-octulosonic acid transferase, partial [Candidatus Binatia bacterium]